MRKADKFINASFSAAGKVASLPIPTWAKVAIAVVAGASAVAVTQDADMAEVASFIIQSNMGG